MNLQDRYFNYILNGTKRIELRLADEKRQLINLGDNIVFFNSRGENFSATVIGLNKYRSFEELFRDFEIDILADRSMTKKEFLEILSEFYAQDKQQKYGVLGIRVEL